MRAMRWTATVLGLGILGCSGGSPVDTVRPDAPYYRNPQADFAGIDSLTVHFQSVTTSNSEGVDLTRNEFFGSIKTHLGPRFGPVSEGTAASTPGGALLEVRVEVNWGSRAARALVGWGAGRAAITIRYELKDASGKLLSRMETTDTMSGGAFGGNAKALVFNAAEKWNAFFALHLAQHPPAGE